jgi:hypothetical protein
LHGPHDEPEEKEEQPETDKAPEELLPVASIPPKEESDDIRSDSSAGVRAQVEALNEILSADPGTMTDEKADAIMKAHAPSHTGTVTGRLDSSLPHYSNISKTDPIAIVSEKVAIEATVIEEHPAIPHRVECPQCKQMIETFGIEGARFFIEHESKTEDGIGSDCEQSEESIPPVKPIPTNGFKPHELAQIQNAAVENGAEAARVAASNERGEQVRPLTNHLKKSLVPSPSKLVWEIADQLKISNPTWQRKDIIKHLESKGIAHFTARTQYQQWLKANRESTANAALANAKK